MTLSAYLPQDRLRALARGETLPDRTTGSALFADISGFTLLTEKLTQTLGPRRGIEELTRKINAVYDTLIAEVEKYGGSVIGFAGDAITCWFDEIADYGLWIADFPSIQKSTINNQQSALRAVTCALALQAAMRQFPDLRLKVAVTTGPVRRFVVGDPEIQFIDTLAGATLARTTTAEHLARGSEVILDDVTVHVLSEFLTIQEWRAEEESGERFAIIDTFTETSTPVEQPPSSLNIPPELAQAWVHQALLQREESFLTEFRPCAVLFVRFTGVNYEADDAEKQLDAFVRQMQYFAERYEGTLLQITIGDKGSYAYINFGALSAHEDDTRRAVRTALELMKASPLQLQMGITQGLMRVGAYGGKTRKTFGAMGDEVNLAARLMTNAAAGEILVSGYVQKAIERQFVVAPRALLSIKGRAKPFPVFAVTGERKQRAIRLQEPNYALPMVGRRSELRMIEAKLDLAAEGAGQVVGIVAEAGFGKSRLVAEVIRSAYRKGFVGYGGACQSDGIHTPYLTWKAIWRAFFNINPDIPLNQQTQYIESEIEHRAPNRVDAMPLLNAVLDLNIPENDFTQNLEPKTRQSALHALLEDCLKAAAKDDPLLIVIEDLHWIDALSHDLSEQLAKALANYAVCFVLAYRPPELLRLQESRLEALPQFTRLELHELNQVEAEDAIRAKLAQLYPVRGGAVPAQLVEMLMARAQGNPFYLEELLNYLHDRALDPRELSTLERLELPDSLHALILSRIDQLSEQEKTTLRVASIVGRLVRAKWLMGYYPELGAPTQVKAALNALDTLDITPLDTPEPELAYLFKHIVTHEVTYESLSYATRTRLHERLAQYLENTYPEALPVEALAFHYGRTENIKKQREYLLKAGKMAQKNFANDAALDFYGQLLPLLQEKMESWEVHMRLGQVLELIGRWGEAEASYLAALEIGKQDMAQTAETHFALGKVNRMRGEYGPALDWLAQARQERAMLGDGAGLAIVLIEFAMVLYRQGKYGEAHEPLKEGFALAQEAGDKLSMALALNNLGNVILDQGDNKTPQALYEESLKLRREMGNKEGISGSLNNLGIVAFIRGDYPAAWALYEESMVVAREMGDKWGVAILLGNMGNLALARRDYPVAWKLFQETLVLRRELGYRQSIAGALCYLGAIARAQGNRDTALDLLEESLATRDEGDKTGIAATLLGLGLVKLEQSTLEARESILDSLRMRQELGEQVMLTSSLIGAAALALHNGNTTRATQLLGAVEAALEARNAVIEPEVIYDHTQTLAAVREALGEMAFQAAWEQGSKWTLEEAVKQALEE